MKKTLISVDDELIEFIKKDAEKERRSMSGQICMLIELCKQNGGYSTIVEKLNTYDLLVSAREYNGCNLDNEEV